jgi:hypothetical protein
MGSRAGWVADSSTILRWTTFWRPHSSIAQVVGEGTREEGENGGKWGVRIEPVEREERGCGGTRCSEKEIGGESKSMTCIALIGIKDPNNPFAGPLSKPRLFRDYGVFVWLFLFVY